MNDTLSLNKLEKIIELEATLREEYQQKLDEKDASIAVLTQDKATLEKKVSELEQTVATQVKTITEVSAKSQDKQALEQRNRELHNRSDNMKEEVAAMKARLKALQKDLAAERTELAELKKYDPQRLRKNLDASKRKLADKTNAADKLQKTLTQARAENAQLEQTIKELEAQLEEAKPEPDSESEGGQEAAWILPPLSGSYTTRGYRTSKTRLIRAFEYQPRYSAGVGRE